ncbi:clorobiocin biosynthesis protein CloN4 [Sinosporangium album]|uniref:Clorobiocin biosynthesis protein CloN4 n=1 Tax=Sinosporangium album TaxID=504805 RepID=A0A1G7ZEF2_9ACTN|nr:amino acid adenylation domain-containing protein [Sinosporangium album]SDH06916.1 clorobiocin biosynthesis protein CloN4 [Sinosporangium album]
MSLHDYVVETAARHPERPAVRWVGGVLRYGELNARADALARALAAHGVGRGDRVPIWSAKSPRTVVAMQAVLRLGAVYVPVASTTPAARLAVVAADCGAAAVCTTPSGVERLAGILAPGTALVDMGQDLRPAEPVYTAVAPGEPAYILYTSGSTGRPKGVCVGHGNARAFVDWAVAELAVTPRDRLANHAPLTFDLSVLDLYAAFAAGASVHLVPPELAYTPVRLARLVRDEGITIWYSVPSALTLMIRDGGLLDEPAPPALRAVLFAGEPFAVEHVRRLAAWTGARLLNLYGPTETNVCTFHEVRPEDLRRDQPVPIGRASCGDTVWAVRRDGGVAAPGDEGVLHVDGPTVMLGYWGREPQTGPYRTGDVVRVRDDGAFDFLGRDDDLVKVRGHRVEPAEVEAVLTAHPDVGEAAVVVRGEGADAALVAFVVAGPGGPPGVLALKRHTAERLPPYMIPEQIRFTTVLPRTANGKTDRAGLKERAQ